MTEKAQMDLMHLRRVLLSMGASAESRVRRSFEAVFTRNADIAREVRESDDEIDAMEVNVEMECIEILALDQPMAGDLRFVLAAMRISGSLERIADLARTISKQVIKVGQTPPIEYPPSLREMADQTMQMVSDALKALSDSDVALANSIRRSDRFVDSKNKEFFAWVVNTLSERPEEARAMMRILIMGRTIERIADIAANIAEDVIFTVRGAIVRHTPA